jgi:hypothetical protein
MARETPGQAASMTVLADIEATVDGLCACGCGVQLGPRSRSAWFATQDCQERWNRRDLDPESARIMSSCPLAPEYYALAGEIERARSRILLAPADNRVDLRIHTNTDWLDLGNNRAVLIDWLEANGVDHRQVPADGIIEVANGELRVTVMLHRDGRPVYNGPGVRWEPLRVPLRVPLDAALVTDEAPPPPRVTWVPRGGGF